MPYRFAVAAADPPPLQAPGGMRIDVDGGLELLREANLIVVPGWRDLDDAPATGLITRAFATPSKAARASLRSARARSCLRMRDCLMVVALRPTGAILSGSLDFPAIRVEPDALYMDEGHS